MGYLYALLAAVLFGANGSVTKATMEAGLTPAQVTEFRLVGTAIIAGLVLLETNIQPGMTPTSLTPEQAAHVGISFPELCRWIVEDASCDR